MKVLGLLAILLLAGCAPVKTLQQLELEAAQTGDWSAVEKRERILARTNDEATASCPVGYVNFCQTFAGRERCDCVSRQGMRQMFAGR